MKIFVRFLRIGLLGFGGPVAQIATLQRELVEGEKWTTHARFNRALAVYQVLPGPEALELCCWLGAVRAGRLGALAAGVGFALPGCLLVLAAAWLYTSGGMPTWAAGALAGAQCASLALIFRAIERIGSHTLNGSTSWFIAIASGYCTLVGLPFWITMPMAGLAAYLADRRLNWIGFSLLGAMAFFATWMTLAQVLSPVEQDVIISGTGLNAGKAPPIQAFFTGLAGGACSFGGAYTAIPILREIAVVQADWLSHGQLLDGVAITSCLPAPLVSVAGFVGYLAGGWDGALLMLGGMLLPAFAFTLIGHDHIERLIANEHLHATFDGLAAAVVGILAAGAIMMLGPTLRGAGGQTEWLRVAIFLIALVVLVRWRSGWIGPSVVLVSTITSAVASSVVT